MRKIGIYPGSFDPVHAGHLAFAKEARQQLKLDTVIFMPERFPRGKPHISPQSERVTELEFALSKTPFEVLQVQSDQFTVDNTLSELVMLYPNAHLTLLIGSDVSLTLATWDNFDYLARTVDFAIGMRSGNTEERVRVVLEDLGIRYHIVTTPYDRLSSTKLRSIKE